MEYFYVFDGYSDKTKTFEDVSDVSESSHTSNC